MDQPSISVVSTSIDISLVGIRVDDCVSDDTKDDSIPFTEGISSTMFCWSGATTQGLFYYFLHGRSLTDRRSCFNLVVHVSVTAHLTNLVIEIVLGGLAKRAGS
jgi:hypothetical protein